MTWTGRPPIGTKPESEHWLFSELLYQWVKATWNGDRWIVSGFSETQHPADMVKEWMLYYVEPRKPRSRKPSKEGRAIFWELYAHEEDDDDGETDEEHGSFEETMS